MQEGLFDDVFTANYHTIKAVCMGRVQAYSTKYFDFVGHWAAYCLGLCFLAFDGYVLRHVSSTALMGICDHLAQLQYNIQLERLNRGLQPAQFPFALPTMGSQQSTRQHQYPAGLLDPSPHSANLVLPVLDDDNIMGSPRSSHRMPSSPLSPANLSHFQHNMDAPSSTHLGPNTPFSPTRPHLTSPPVVQGHGRIPMAASTPGHVSSAASPVASGMAVHHNGHPHLQTPHGEAPPPPNANAGGAPTKLRPSQLLEPTSFQMYHNQSPAIHRQPPPQPQPPLQSSSAPLSSIHHAAPATSTSSAGRIQHAPQVPSRPHRPIPPPQQTSQQSIRQSSALAPDRLSQHRTQPSPAAPAAAAYQAIRQQTPQNPPAVGTRRSSRLLRKRTHVDEQPPDQLQQFDTTEPRRLPTRRRQL